MTDVLVAFADLNTMDNFRSFGTISVFKGNDTFINYTFTRYVLRYGAWLVE